MCQFRVPHSIVSNNGPQFISKSYQQFCTECGIKNIHSTPRHPQSNRQAKVTNKTLLDYLKKGLTAAKGKWVDELPIALWAYRTTPKQPAKETLYALAFEAEALILVESGFEPLRSDDASELAQALDELEEKREQATVIMVKYHRRVFRQRATLIKLRAFCKRYLVLRRTFEEGKLKPNWEGPFIIVDNGCKGAYRIQSQRGKMEPRPWNLAYLKKYFH